MIPKQLHVYAQGAWHDPLRIVGTREGREALADAVRYALTSERVGRVALTDSTGGAWHDYAGEVFTSDGEGYNFAIRVSDKDEDYPGLPYNERLANGEARNTRLDDDKEKV
jgi:hypothetical protein